MPFLRAAARSFLVFTLLFGLFSFSAQAIDPEPEESDAGSFNVFEILNTKDDYQDAECGDDQECITATLLEEGEEAGTSGIGAAILRAINILTLLISTFAFVMMVIGGFMFATSQGNETTIDRAKNIMSQSLLGLVLAFFSYLIVVAVQSLFY
ncbi:MAG: hypothetical protein AAB802_02060 [Patescibacteria group bacterium]